ncbi:MAG: hypothetical protein R3F17_10915 [Planctomycetota bacterium]
MITSEDRILLPHVRREDGSFEAVTWDQALARIAERVKPCRGTHPEPGLCRQHGGARAAFSEA